MHFLLTLIEYTSRNFHLHIVSRYVELMHVQYTDTLLNHLKFCNDADYCNSRFCCVRPNVDLEYKEKVATKNVVK